jgi:membrane-associated protease RseP (regulator of RpoE activity)
MAGRRLWLGVVVLFWLVATAPAEEYWLGLNTAPPSDMMRNRLKLSAGEGLVVEYVVVNSPAAKSGIKLHDVLVKADGKPLRAAGDLIDVIQKAKQQEIHIDLIRGGKTEKVTVKPAKREVVVNVRLGGFQAVPRHDIVARPDLTLPDDMTLTISKTGKKPAKITAEQGAQKWEATEGELEKLPDPVRAYVERMLRHSTDASHHD